MRPAPFAYYRPLTVQQAVQQLADHGPGARVLAGGQSLLPLMNRRLVRPAGLVDLCLLPGLAEIRRDGPALTLGAMSTHQAVRTAITTAPGSGFSVLREAADLIGHLPVRTVGTVGGSLANADPAAEWCLLSVLLDAEVVIAGRRGVRVVAVGAFLTGRPVGEPCGGTALGPDEIVIGIRIPAPAPSATVVEFSVQPQALPVVGAAAAVEVDAAGRISRARVALGGVADRAIRLTALEADLVGRPAEVATAATAGHTAAASIDPPTDARADAGYRRRLTGVLTTRAITGSLERAARQRSARGPQLPGPERRPEGLPTP